MTKRTIYDCDQCDKRGVEVIQLVVTTGRRTDAAGSIDEIGDAVDLCHTCAAAVIYEFLQRMSYQDRQVWLAAIRARP